MLLYTIQEAQQNLAHLLEAAIQGDQMIVIEGGGKQAFLWPLKSLDNRPPGPGPHVAIIYDDEEDHAKDPLVAPLDDEIIEEFYKPLSDKIVSALEGR